MHSQDPPVIHRDLKPDNILLLGFKRRAANGFPIPNTWVCDGRIILLDLGVARPLVRGAVGTAIGTPGYAAPEQYQGFADERSDLYALGATLHYMLTGYDAESEAPFRHPPIRQLRPDVSPAVDDLVTEMLRIDPRGRPVSAHRVRQYAKYHTTGQCEAQEISLALEFANKDVKVTGVGAAFSAVASLAFVLVWTRQLGMMRLDLLWPAFQIPLYSASVIPGIVRRRGIKRADELTQRAHARFVKSKKQMTRSRWIICAVMLLSVAMCVACTLTTSSLAGIFLAVLVLIECAGLALDSIFARASLHRSVQLAPVLYDGQAGRVAQLHC